MSENNGNKSDESISVGSENEGKMRKIFHKQKNKHHEEVKVKLITVKVMFHPQKNKWLAKTYKLISQCCTNKYHEKVLHVEQLELFNSFYSGQPKGLQDLYIARCMILASQLNKKTLHPKKLGHTI